MSGYIGPQPVPQATQHREAFTATASQTSFATAGYTPQFIDVYLNGVKLVPADYTATNGSDVVLTTGAAASDILEYVAYTPFEVANQTFTGTTTTDALTVTGAFTSLGIDDNAAATAMTLDASGNVLIGKTVDDLTTQGTRIRSNALDTSRDSSAALNVNRNGTDGDMVVFYKSGTTVGSIGALTGALTVGGSGTNAGLYYGTQGLLPTQGGALSDNTKDLGSAAYRLNDAYIGGGVYLGGTGAANKLDDYEEGTWSPIIASGGFGTGAVSHASYTKIGNLVSVRTIFNVTGSGSASTLTVSGLPFSSVTDGYAIGGFGSGKGGVRGMYSRTGSNNTTIEFLYPSGVLVDDRILVKGNQIGTGYFIITLTYSTAA